MGKTSIVIAAFLFLLAPLAAQTITVVAPNGGETLTLGGSCQISWTTTGVSGSVRIQLRRPGGAIVGVIAPGMAHDGSPYTWTVGETNNGTADAGNYRICVMALDGSASDVSDANFALAAAGAPEPEPTPTPTLTIISPRAGETWYEGTYYNITWEGEDLTGEGQIRKYHNATGEGSFGWFADVSLRDRSYRWQADNNLPAHDARDRDATYFYRIGIYRDSHTPVAFSEPFHIVGTAQHDFIIKDPVLISHGGHKNFQVTIWDTENDYDGPLVISYWCNKMALGQAIKATKNVSLVHMRDGGSTVELPDISPEYFRNECDVNFVFEVNAGHAVAETDYRNNATQKKFCWNQLDGRFVQLRVGKNYTETCEMCGVTIRPADVESFTGETVRVRLEITVQNCGRTPIRDATIGVTQSWAYRSDRGIRSVDHIHNINIEPGNFALLRRTVTLERHLNNTLAFDFDSGESEGSPHGGNNKFNCKPNFVGF